jgi:hypothetical protein
MITTPPFFGFWKPAAVAGGGPSAWVNKYNANMTEDPTTHALTAVNYGLENNGAGTADSIPIGGGSVKTIAALNTTTKGFGIDVSNSHVERGSRDTDFFLLLKGDGTTEMQVNFGYGVAPFFAYAGGDEIKIHVSADRIVESLVNSVVKKSEGYLAANAPLYGVVSLETVGAVMNPLTFGPLESGTPPANAPTWRNKSKCAVGLSNVLVGLADGYYSGAFATSNESLVAGVGGTFKMKVSALPGTHAGGLTTNASPSHPFDLKRGFLVYGGTNGQIWENGSDVVGFTVAAGDDLEVNIDTAGIARWYHSGVLLRTSGSALAFPVYAMGYFQNRGARLEGVRLY